MKLTIQFRRQFNLFVAKRKDKITRRNKQSWLWNDFFYNRDYIDCVILSNDAPPLGLELGVPGLDEDVGVAAEPEEGQDGAASTAHRGVELDTPAGTLSILSWSAHHQMSWSPDVGGEPGTPEQDGHLVITPGA